MIRYFKIESNGNNFLLFDNRNLAFDDKTLKRICIKDCDVNKGFGADGLLVLDNSSRESFLMRLINKNGDEGEMCGNGARCIAYFANSISLVPKDFSFETLAGTIKASVYGDRVRINMGDIELSSVGKSEEISILGHNISYVSLNVGVPHIVIPYETGSLKERDMKEIGSKLCLDKTRFPKGTNVNFMALGQGDEIFVSTFERGVEDITASCGTGSCACAIVYSLAQKLSPKIRVINPGGVNWVHLRRYGDKVNVGLEGIVSMSGVIISYISPQGD